MRFLFLLVFIQLFQNLIQKPKVKLLKFSLYFQVSLEIEYFEKELILLSRVPSEGSSLFVFKNAMKGFFSELISKLKIW